MESESVINDKIVAITTRIHKDFPQLSAYLAVNPVTKSDEPNSVSDILKLQKHYQSLQTMLRKFTIDKTGL